MNHGFLTIGTKIVVFLHKGFRWQTTGAAVIEQPTYRAGKVLHYISGSTTGLLLVTLGKKLLKASQLHSSPGRKKKPKTNKKSTQTQIIAGRDSGMIL